MNIFNIGIILILLITTITGIKRGVIKEAVSLVGIILVLFISFTFKEEVGNILIKYLPFFKFTGTLQGITSLNIFIYQVLGFLLLFTILLSVYSILISISKILQKLVNFTIILIIPSAILGGIIGFIRGYILSFVILLFLLIPLNQTPDFNDSKLINNILYKTPILSEKVKPITNSIKDISKVLKEIRDIKEVNNKLIDIMKENNLITKDFVEELVKANKL